MLFTEYNWIGFNDLNNIQKSLYTAPVTTVINAISIYDNTTSPDNIKVNLKLIKPNASAEDLECLLLSNHELEKGNRHNIVDYLENNLIIPAGDSISIYSNSHYQLFTCVIFYTKLPETAVPNERRTKKSFTRA